MNSRPSKPHLLRWKRKLLCTCAVAGASLALTVASPAAAQWAAEIQGATPPNVFVGTVGTTTTVEIQDTPNAQHIINWTPNNIPATGNVVLLPSDSTLTFTGTGGALNDFTVLNRIVDASGGAFDRLVEINGTVNSNGNLSGFQQQGGNIWFQNAGGILVGATGVFNVGSLILTSRTIDTANGLVDPAGVIRFGNSGTGGAITNLGQINANNGLIGGSTYVAMVAPRIIHRGVVTAAGSVAYIAAESAELTINSNLFSINMLVGAEGGTVIDHSGDTLAHNAADPANIYLTALSKNSAITMLVGGNIGTTSASVNDDGTITLSAGHNITNGALANSATTDFRDNIQIGAGDFSKNLTARASGTIAANVAAAETLRFAQAELNGDAGVSINSSGTITADLLNLTSQGTDTASGQAAITLTGGSMTVGDTLTLNADRNGDATTGNATGGNATILLSNDAALSSGRIQITANAFAADSSNAVGGNATGGTVLIQTQGASALSANAINASTYADARSNSTSGSDAVGGNITLLIGGQTFINDSMDLSAEASGGNGQGGSIGGQPTASGGNARGGNITVSLGANLEDRAVSIDATTSASAGRGGEVDGSAGNVGTGSGGTATGGDISFTDLRAGAASGLTLIFGATGSGGDSGYVEGTAPDTPIPAQGGSGGVGTGGNVTVVLSGEYDDAVIDINASGTGGDGRRHNNGGNGGVGQGGLASVTALNTGLNVLDLRLTATGSGGQGGEGLVGNAGQGGAGIGGVTELVMRGAGADIILSPTNFLADGFGGTGGRGSGDGSFIASNGGRGGDGMGGTIRLQADDQGSITLFQAVGSSGLSITTQNQNGAGGDSDNFNGGASGDAIGGSIELIANGGTITATEDLSLNADTILNGGGIGAVNGADGASTGGRVALSTANNGSITLGNVNMIADGQNAGRITLSSASGGSILTANLFASAAGDAALTNGDTLTSPSGIVLQADGGSITAASIDVSTGGSLGLFGAGNGTISSTGDFIVNAADQVELRHTAPAGTAPTLSADYLSINAGSDIVGGAGSRINGTTMVKLSADSGIDVGGISSGGAVQVDAANGAVQVADLRTPAEVVIRGTAVSIANSGSLNFERVEASTGNITLNSEGDILIGSGDAAGNLSATAGGQIDVQNSVAGGDLILSGAGLSLSTSNSGNDILLNSTQNLSINEISAGNNLTATATGVLFAENLSANGDASFTGNQLTLRGATITGNATANTTGSLLLDNVDAGANLTATSNANLILQNIVSAQSIQFTSADISIESGAQIRAFDPDLGITLTNNNAALPTYIGGVNPPAGGGYHLDAAEIQALANSSLRIIAPNVAGNSAADLVIGAFTITDANLGDEGRVSFETTGRILVNGAAELSGITQNNGFTLTAGEGVDIIMGQGALRATNAAANPSGFITFIAPRVALATQAALTDLAGLTSVEQMENRLLLNDGFAADNGGLLAGTINANVTTSFFAQNSGDGSEAINRRGITFGAGGLNFTTTADSLIIANGVQVTANGTLTGGAVIAGITINGNAPTATSSFNRQSMMNSCVIINPTTCGSAVFTPVSLPIPPIQDIVQEPVTKDQDEVENDDREASSIPDTLISMRDLDVQTGAPLVDDPATGAGNDDLWGPVTD